MEPASDLIAAAASAFKRGFGAVLAIEPVDAPPFFIDGRGDHCSISPEPPDEAPSCIWRAGPDTLMRIFGGGRALESAFLTGRLKISGDMSVMARLLLEASR